MKRASLAIIPARGGSKRIPRKNIKPFLGKPIIAYSIEAAANTSLFSRVTVSTDDKEISRIARKFGGEVPFQRSAVNASDIAPVADVILEVLDYYDNLGIQFEFVCCLFATAPFITPALLKEGFSLLKKNKLDSVFAVIPFSHPIQRAFRFKGSKVAMIHPENYLKRTQDLPKSYHDAGLFYWLNTARFRKTRKLFTSNSGAVVLDELHSHDIDSPLDWKLAELKMKLLQVKNDA